jgi:hypothetical protein
MISTRTVGLGLGLMLLLAIGSATWLPAQQAGEKAASAAPKGGELRERVLRLRTETEVLQVEYDAARANLAKALELVWAAEFVLFDTVAGGALHLRGKEGTEASQIIESIRSGGANDLKGVDGTKLAKAVRGLANGEKGAGKDLLDALKGLQNPQTALVDVTKSEFTRLSTELNRKKLDLAEAERQYQREAR